MLFSSIVRFFRSGNVSVIGLRGTGKDVLTGNVIARRKQQYVGNLKYTTDDEYFNELDFSKLDCGGNTYLNLLEGDVKYYKYPYPSGSDIYISDVGIYFPAQYCNELNRKYPHLPMYFALSRQLSHNNVHFNVQNLNRAWDKLREQSDIYIYCRRCIVFCGIVFHWIRLYDKYDSCVNRVQPCRVRVPLFNTEARVNARIYQDNFFNTHGTVKNKFLIYFNRSGHDTFYFEKLFEGGVKDEDSEKDQKVSSKKQS